jgi:uncharacterized membrane protein (UPF0127 family)
MIRTHSPVATPAAAAILLLLLSFPLLDACSAVESGDAITPPAGTVLPTVSPDLLATPSAAEALTITTVAGGSIRLTAEIAETVEQRRQGLMGRDELAADAGMLFVIEPPGRGFWMRGTTVPLTVAFIAECGEIVDFADLDPLSEEIKNTDQPYTFALEMAQGWFVANGIAIGDVVELPMRFLADGC